MDCKTVTVKTLRKLARERNIVGRSKLRTKAALCKALGLTPTGRPRKRVTPTRQRATRTTFPQPSTELVDKYNIPSHFGRDQVQLCRIPKGTRLYAARQVYTNNEKVKVPWLLENFADRTKSKTVGIGYWFSLDPGVAYSYADNVFSRYDYAVVIIEVTALRDLDLVCLHKVTNVAWLRKLMPDKLSRDEFNAAIRVCAPSPQQEPYVFRMSEMNMDANVMLNACKSGQIVGYTTPKLAGTCPAKTARLMSEVFLCQSRNIITLTFMWAYNPGLHNSILPDTAPTNVFAKQYQHKDVSSYFKIREADITKRSYVPSWVRNPPS